MLLAWVTGRKLVSSLSGILSDKSTKILGKNNTQTSPISTKSQSIWSNYINKPTKKTTFIHKDEGILSKMYTNLKEAVKENKFTTAVLLFLHIKSDKRYQNLNHAEKQKLHELLKKYNYDMDNIPEAIEKINLFLKYHNAKSKNKNKDFANAMKDSAKFSMKSNYKLLTSKDCEPELIFNKIEKSLNDDNILNVAMMDYFSDGMSGNEKAEFIGESSKNSVFARKAAFKSLEDLIKKNPTTKEKIEKLFELHKSSSLSLSDMVIKLLEATDCDEKTKSKIRKTILKIKNGIPEEYEKNLEELKKSEAWYYIIQTKEKMIKYAKEKVDFAEGMVRNQEIRVEKKEKEFKAENRKLSESKYKAKKMKRQADEIIEHVRLKNNLGMIPEHHKDEVIKNNDTIVYKRYKNSQEELKKATAAEYDAASELRLAEAFLKIDKNERDFEVARYNCLLNCC